MLRCHPHGENISQMFTNVQSKSSLKCVLNYEHFLPLHCIFQKDIFCVSEITSSWYVISPEFFSQVQKNTMAKKWMPLAQTTKMYNLLTYRYVASSATPLMEIQREALILGNNMSSGVTVPIFGKKFAKMRQWEQLEVQDNSSENKASV